METGTVSKRQQLNQTVKPFFFLNNNNDDGAYPGKGENGYIFPRGEK
jgi:hypothetical protein